MSIKLARTLFVLVVVGIAYALYSSCNLLPESIAANFGKGGRVVSFNSRETYRALMTIIALVLPVLIYIVMALLPRRINPRFVCSAYPNYWFSPEHRPSTLLWIEKFGLVVGALVSVFWFALHMVNFRATIIDTPHYELWPRLSLLIGWLIFIAIAGVVHGMHFRRVP